MPEGTPARGPHNLKAADDRQDRTTAFAAFAGLSLDADDGDVDRPSRNRRRAVFRHLAAGVVADRGGVGARRLCPRAGLYRQLTPTPDSVRLHLGDDASFTVQA